jgi:hypothetical protein
LQGETRNYFSGFEGSQAVPTGPYGRGNAHDWNYFFLYITFEGLHQSEIFMFSMGGLLVKHAVQRGIWLPTQHLL